MEVSEAEFDRAWDINVKSIFHMIHTIVPSWADRVAAWW